MPKTTAAHKQSLISPAMCSLLPIRDFLDGVMVRLDGSYVAGFRINGALTYFADDGTRNEMKGLIDSLIRTVPEESMRIQFRYEVVEGTNGLLDRYADFRRTSSEAALVLDKNREEILRGKEREWEYLTRIAGVYFIWNPAVHRKVTGTGDDKKAAKGGGGFTLSTKKAIEAGEKEHRDTLSRFESIIKGIETSLINGGLNPERYTHDELFLEVKRALNPIAPDSAPLKSPFCSSRYISAREQLASVSILDEKDTYVNIDGILWSTITLKMAPDATYPGILRELLTIGFPLVISTQLVIPNQQQVLEQYKKRYKKLKAAQQDMRGNQRVDIAAQVSAQELLAMQEHMIASSVKTVRLSLTIAVRTSAPAITLSDYEEAERDLAVRRQQIVHVLSRMNGARGLAEIMGAQQRILVGTLPACADEDKRDLDLLSPHAADLVPVEMPWGGTPKSPLMLFDTPYRQLLPFSPFDPSLENANALIAATSGTGKSVLVGLMLMAAARQDVNVSILERGDSYFPVVRYMNGQMITMSLDSKHTINPFDPEPGCSLPTNDHLAFLKNLTRYMIGDKGAADSDLLDNIILRSIGNAYKRAAMRLDNPIPTFSDLRDELANYYDENKNETVNQTARVAAIKLGIWVDDGMYANLFDRQTTVDMNVPWLYFNIEQLKDDKRLETAMSLLIAYTTTKRAQGKGGKRCITVLDECWALLESESLGPVVVQLFRTARKRNACVWAVSQAVEDFTGTPEKPNPFGGAILTTTALKLIGRQKGNADVLRDFLHVNPTTLQYIKQLGMTEKGKKSEFLLIVGEKAETTQSLYVVPTPLQYWVMTTFPRERVWRDYWLQKHSHLPVPARYALLAETYPQGISGLDELPEERSGEVYKALQGPGGVIAAPSAEEVYA